MKLLLHPYQIKALDFVIKNKKCGLFLDMGLGKTAIVLQAIKYCLTENTSIHNVLVVGPKRVIQHTWPDEINKWDDFKGMTYSIVDGTDAMRRKALQAKAHVYLISRDNLAWLVENGLLQHNMLVIDELSSFKNPASKRFKSIKFKYDYFKRVIGMTGTPTPNGLIDLWSQMFILDKGERLEHTVSAYRMKYFTATAYAGFPQYTLKPGSDGKITDAISDICISMTSEDYLSLPKVVKYEHKLSMTPTVKQQYKDFKANMLLELQNSSEVITAVNAAVLCGKLLQFCGGNVYNQAKEAQRIHTLKLDKLEDLHESANGSPLLVYYVYQSERDQILERFPTARDIKEPGVIEQWCKGNIDILVAHPASAGHGLNLQSGGNSVIWYNLTYDLELYLQANKRLHRMGQTKPVFIHHLTIDEGTDTVILNQVLSKKGKIMDAVIASLRA